MSDQQIFVQHGLTGRIRQVQATDLANLQAEHKAWKQISAEDAAADVRYVRNRWGVVHSIPSADLADALAVDGVEEVRPKPAREPGDAGAA